MTEQINKVGNKGAPTVTVFKQSVKSAKKRKAKA